MRRVRPTQLVLAELELWPNLITAALRRAVKVAIVNGRLSDKSFRGYRHVRPLVARVLRRIDLIAAQNNETAERFVALGARGESVVATGSLKFDGAKTDRDNPKTSALKELAGITSDDIVFLAGSTQDPEEQYAVDILQQLSVKHEHLRLILVPRHPERFDEVAAMLDRSGVPWQRRSTLSHDTGSRGQTSSPVSLSAPHRRAGLLAVNEVEHAPSHGSDDMHCRWSVLLVDTVGELGSWWGAASVGFVGGSFGSRGGQNMLEPAAYGVATCFGPNTWNFRDIVAQLLTADGARIVNTPGELESFLRWALERPCEAKSLGERARRHVLSQQGAAARTADLLVALVKSESSAASDNRMAA
jgi:3-deoxy-D-manno-octulosonic-acid transferase